MTARYNMLRVCKHCGIEEQITTSHKWKEGSEQIFVCPNCKGKGAKKLTQISPQSPFRCELCKHYGVRHSSAQGEPSRFWKPCGLGHEGDFAEDNGEGYNYHLVYAYTTCDDHEPK